MGIAATHRYLGQVRITEACLALQAIEADPGVVYIEHKGGIRGVSKSLVSPISEGEPLPEPLAVHALFYSYSSEEGSRETLCGIFGTQSKADDAILEICQNCAGRRDGNGQEISLDHFHVRAVPLNRILEKDFGSPPPVF